MEKIKLMQGDCLELMKGIADKSVDMILCDLPYGTTECRWDSVIDEYRLFQEYRRILKDTGTVALTVAFPFGASFILNNKDLFKYDLVWKKSKITDFANAKNKFMRGHENILIFSKGTTANGSNRKMTYNPQGLVKINKTRTNSRAKRSNIGIRDNYNNNVYRQEYTNYPNTVLEFQSETSTVHPTQKPVPLFEYLIRTYTNEGETVLDNCMGSGTTGVACLNTNRRFIGIELDETYFNIAKERIYATERVTESN
jgi:site-specific DNA-methyltransferase (adenine-specific)